MEYRLFPKTDEKVSLLGFGLMRLPVINGDDAKIDEDEAIRMIRYAIDHGVNYMDTAYMYHGGNSEGVLRKALADGYREKVYIADKFPIWMVKQAGGVEALFRDQLKRLGVERIDFYLVHALSKSNFEQVQKQDVLPFLEQMKAEGRIGKLGFSFHDELEVFKEIVDAYPWEFCQLQLNYMDETFQAGTEGFQYAVDRGLPMIIMEPLKGGKLSQDVPPSVHTIWSKANTKRSPAEWAFRYVANFPQVFTVLSGMSTMEQVKENLEIFEDMKPKSLTEEESHLIREAAEEYRRLIKAGCTACRYCIPCPESIEIPTVINYYNQWHLYHTYRALKRDYDMDVPAANGPDRCVACGECESKCPQQLPIIQLMAETADIYREPAI